MSITPTQLRANLYKILDQVIETQEPIEIVRAGQLLEISIKSTEKQPNSLKNLKPHPDTINGDPDSLIHMDWSSY
jgi:hypothetical protein